jgi:hypothetical protein
MLSALSPEARVIHNDTRYANSDPLQFDVDKFDPDPLFDVNDL